MQNELANIEMFNADEDWAKLRRPVALDNLDRRHRSLDHALKDREWFAGEFSIADIAMVSVLRSSVAMGTLTEHPTLAAYVDRGTERPAFQQALADQLAGFDPSHAPGMEHA